MKLFLLPAGKELAFTSILSSPQIRFLMKVTIFVWVSMAISLQLVALDTEGQSIDQIEITLELHNAKLSDALRLIQNKTGVNFVFTPDHVKSFDDVNLPLAKRTVRKTLDLILTETDLVYREQGETVIVFARKSETKRAGADVGETTTLNTSQLIVRGIVTDSKTHQPLPGVNIMIKGTLRGTRTDANGSYVLEVYSDSDVLSFSFIGFKILETEVGKKTNIDVAMEEDVAALDEVVISAGYYDVSDRDKTGSIAGVDAEDIGKQPANNPMGVLQARIPGVQVQQTGGVPGSDFRVEIRGRNSLRSNGNQPLYIVDGVPFYMEKVSSGYATGAAFGGVNSEQDAGTSPMASINQADIESIQVLKDADATAIYGSRGANGVVLITTKKGKPGKNVFELNFTKGIGMVPRVKMLNTQQYLAVRRQAFINDELEPSSDPASKSFAPDLTVWDTARYTDWQEELIGISNSTNIQGSLSGGTGKTRFLLSTGYRKESSVVRRGDFSYQKGSFHLSLDHRSTNDRFFFNLSINGTKDENRQVRIDNTGVARFLAPNAPSLYMSNGDLNWANSTWQNPLAGLDRKYDGNTFNFIANTVLGYEIVKNLSIKSNIGVNYLTSDETAKQPSTIYDPAGGRTSADSYVALASGNTQSWIVEPQINWQKEISRGKLSTLLGASVQGRIFARKSDGYLGFPSNSLLDNFASASDMFSNEVISSIYRYASLFARVNYNWDDRYIVNLTARRDGSSRFGPGRRFANFSAIGGAWLFSNEAIIKEKAPFISFGKIRASYGITGNDQIGDYQYLDTYSTPSSLLSNQYQGIAVLSPTKLFNPSYAWETNRKAEVALESGFLNDRIMLTIGYYNNLSSNQLVDYALPLTTGFGGVLSNLPAKIRNSGWEFELTTINIDGKITWTSSLNLTLPENKLIAFPDIESTTYSNRFTVGESIYIKKKFEYLGVDPQTGYYSFKDFNGDGVLSFPEDNKKSVFVGQYYFGGLSNTIGFKGFSLDILLQFVRQNGGLAGRTPGIMSNYYSFILERDIWREPGDHAEFQRLATNYNSVAMRASNDFLSSNGSVGDASFVRVKNISINYSIPETWTKGIKVQFYFQGQNLFTITKYEGGDPETMTDGQVPPMKIFTGGLKIIL